MISPHHPSIIWCPYNWKRLEKLPQIKNASTKITRTHTAHTCGVFIRGFYSIQCTSYSLPMDHEIKLCGKFTFIFIYAIIINDRNVKQKPIFKTIIRNHSVGQALHGKWKWKLGIWAGEKKDLARIQLKKIRTHAHFLEFNTSSINWTWLWFISIHIMMMKVYYNV